jgi:hypothetical protein
VVSANDSTKVLETSFLDYYPNAATPIAPAVSKTSLNKAAAPSSVPKMSKLFLSNLQSTENERKDSAEKFPKNFALIRLSDKARQAPKPVVQKEPVKRITLHLDEAFDDSTQ